MTHKAYGICKNKCLVEVVTKEQFNGLIPAQASTENQLADKNFVNSSIQTETANFRGNWETWDDVPTEAESYPNDYVGNKTPTVNDYLVVKDYNGNGTWRFKYSGVWEVNGKDGWLEEYQVNETPFTAEQLASINSGITKEKVERYDGMTFPVGTILSGLYASAPNGFLLCDGSEVLISDYPNLYQCAVGNGWLKQGSDTTRFFLPDLRNRFLEGGSNVGEYKEAGLPNITGTFSGDDTNAAEEYTGCFTLSSQVVEGQGNVTGTDRLAIFNASNGETKTDGTLKTDDEHHVYGNSDTVQPASYTVSYIIKY